MISVSCDTTVKVWNLEEKTEEFILEGHTSYIFSVEISKDGMYLISGSADTTVKCEILKKKEKSLL